MVIIHTSFKSKSKKKLTKKEIDLQKQFELMVKANSKPLEKGLRSTTNIKHSMLTVPVKRRQVSEVESLDSNGFFVAAKSMPKVYTGSNMKGIGTMHKSNMVPIFSDDEAKDLSTMRRS